ncbi:MAG TPA: S-ribosylhomocysteine lyase [Clostridiales bacterium]|jgi:S-ribosylhomocysteine lyase|nr:S-ribosylhomocysteine lyase [Clostridiales bacterium]
MKKIESFEVDHERLNRGVYVSRKDIVGDHVVTTYDIRMKRPNREPVMNTGVMHAIEHLGATFLRDHEIYSHNTIYFGPMGCRTGFYLILKGQLSSMDIVPIIHEMFTFIAVFDDEIPGADPVSCGNYQDMDLKGAKLEASVFLNETLEKMTSENLIYPE